MGFGRCHVGWFLGGHERCNRTNKAGDSCMDLCQNTLQRAANKGPENITKLRSNTANVDFLYP